tara:strand:+ start:1875 stop:2060 length:186 start_codon:yes stop_codon:yes gene_type:complete
MSKTEREANGPRGKRGKPGEPGVFTGLRIKYAARVRNEDSGKNKKETPGEQIARRIKESHS